MMVLIIKSCRVHTNRLWLWCWPQGTKFCWYRNDTLIFSQITEWSIPSASKCRHNDFNVHLWPWWWNYIESGLRKTTIFIHLSLCAVLIAHVGGGVLVDAVVGEMREHVPHLCALVAVLVWCEPEFQYRVVQWISSIMCTWRDHHRRGRFWGGWRWWRARTDEDQILCLNVQVKTA